ncbi:orotidine 5'-phosphate decarboxylase / HUMPS family protein [Rhodobacter lacus]|uniref:Orotidine 5'-phosphate decarboxylase / HUMPS family protein n=1 Tax=Rhodobacter lacus TaxID=1641972 RepID=A0ABW5AAC0_9RHOB
MISVTRALRARARGIGVGVFAAPAAAMGAALDALDGLEVVHFDIMDGVFVPQLTGGAAFVAALGTDVLRDVHLMVANPSAQVAGFAAAGADIITVHAEAPDAAEALASVRVEAERLGRPILAGLGVMPGTEIADLDALLALEPDLVLVLALDPRDGAAPNVPEAAARLAALRVRCAPFAPVLAIDGGITDKSIEAACASGADLVVSGSAIFKAANPAEMLARLSAVRAANDLGGDHAK